jgi:aspartate/methionine/tyrosine aminotransferase
MHISPFKLERFFARYEFKAPYLLCTSDCEPISLNDLIKFDENYLKTILDFNLGYVNTDGQEELKNTISRLYKSIKPENLIVTNGAEEAIYLFMNIAINKGEHIIVQYPFYQSLGEIAKHIGAYVSFWECDSKNNWELDIDYLRDNIRDNTKIIVLNMPHNPTGYIADLEKFEAIIEIAREKNIIILNDEVYNGLEIEVNTRLPYISDIYENGVSIGGLSKAYGLAGLRIGWVASRNSSIINEINHYKDFTTICNSGISELLATFALKNRERLLSRSLNIIRNNLKLLHEFFDRYRDLFNFIPPKGGTIAFPEIKREIDIEQFCIDLVNQKGVLLLPGNYYDYDNRHFRIGFGRMNMPRALEVFESYIKEIF